MKKNNTKNPHWVWIDSAAPHLSELLYMFMHIIIKHSCGLVSSLLCSLPKWDISGVRGSRGLKWEQDLVNYIDRCTERLIAMEQIKSTAVALMHVVEKVERMRAKSGQISSRGRKVAGLIPLQRSREPIVQRKRGNWGLLKCSWAKPLSK